jgi:hypothetical protein
LKININKQKEQKVKEMLKTQKLDRSVESFSKSRFFDPSLEQNKRRKIKMRTNAFNFAEKGSYLKKVEEFRNKQLEKGPEEDGKVDEVDKKNLDILNIRPSYISNPLKRTNVRINIIILRTLYQILNGGTVISCQKIKNIFLHFGLRTMKGIIFINKRME